MLGNLSGWHLLILVAVVLLLFGATRLPTPAKSVGQSVSILRREVRHDEGGTAEPVPTDPRPDSAGRSERREAEQGSGEPKG